MYLTLELNPDVQALLEATLLNIKSSDEDFIAVAVEFIFMANDKDLVTSLNLIKNLRMSDAVLLALLHEAEVQENKAIYNAVYSKLYD